MTVCVDITLKHCFLEGLCQINLNDRSIPAVCDQTSDLRAVRFAMFYVVVSVYFFCYPVEFGISMLGYSHRLK